MYRLIHIIFCSYLNLLVDIRWLTFLCWPLLLIVFVPMVETGNVLAFGSSPNLTELWLDLEALNISVECRNEFQKLLFNKTEEFAKALDAFGRPEAGILVQHWDWFGNFPECTNLKGLKYCLLKVDFSTTHLATIKEDSIPIYWGTCAPETCSAEDVQSSAPLMLGNLNLEQGIFDAINVSGIDYCVENPVVPYNPGFYASICLFTFLGLLAISGSILDVIEKRLLSKENADNDQSPELSPLILNEGSELENDPTGSETPPSDSNCCSNMIKKVFSRIRLLLLDFAFNRNLKKLLHVSKTTDQDINCLNGIRVFSMMWIILGHTLLFPIAHGGIYNPVDVYSRIRGQFHQAFVGNFVFAVDSFFFMSGLLVSFNTLGKLEKNNGHLTWYMFYIHRIIRLLPTLLMILLIYMFIMPHLMWGPRAPYFADQHLCQNYWWTTILFINNIYPKMDDICMTWTWYLSNDMQFYIISPLFIYAFFRKPLVGLGMLSLLLSVCMTATGFLVAYDKFALPIWFAPWKPTTDLIYRGPFARVSPYLVGLVVGFIMFKVKVNKTILSKPFFFLCWLIATGVALAVLFGTDVNRPMGIVGSVLFEMFNHFSWGICLSWVVIACRFGGSGWINDILSWTFWVPLSRVTYAVYLIHPILIAIYGGNLGRPYFDSITLGIYNVGAVIFFSYICAMVFSLVVEVPVVNLERRLLPKQ